LRIALFTTTCFNDTLFPQTGRAAVEVLERLGQEVVFPEVQTCSGQVHFNTGYHEEAPGLIRRCVRPFAGEQTIGTPSGSCAAMVHEAHVRAARQAGDAALVREVAELAPRVLELSELLVGRLGVEDVAPTTRTG
jgi:L-lactate dehydrogenase complex protein LldE